LANLYNGKILDDNDIVSPPLPPNNDVVSFLSYGTPAIKTSPWSPVPPWLEPDTQWLVTSISSFVMLSNPPGPRPVKTFQKIQGWGELIPTSFLLHGDVITRTYRAMNHNHNSLFRSRRPGV